MSSDRCEQMIEIIEKAAYLFRQHGYAATNVNQIAAEVKLSKAGLYYYINSKEDLLYSIMDYALERLEDDVHEIFEDRSDHEDRLREITYRHAKFITEHEGAFTALVINHIDALTSEHQPLIRNRIDKYVGVLRATLEKLKGEGKLRDVDVKTTAYNLLRMVIFTSSWFRQDGRLTGNEVAAELAETSLCAVLRDNRC